MTRSLTTDPDLFSQEAWDLLLDGENSAYRWRHEYLDVEHLIEVLFSNPSYKRFVEALPVYIDGLLADLESFLAEIPISNNAKLFIGEDLEQLLETADEFRGKWGSRLIEISHILIAIGRDPRIGAEIFESAGLPSELLETQLKKLPTPKSFNTSQEIKTIKPIKTKQRNETNPINEIRKKSSQINNSSQNSDSIVKNSEKRLSLKEEPKAIEIYGRDLTSEARDGKLDPVIGRDEEIQNIIKVLSRRSKNNPVLIGSPGVGKTAIAELLAQRISNNNVPDAIKGLKLISLDIGALIAGAKFRGQFEERLRSVLSEINDPEAGVILFIDELHSVVNTDRSSADTGSFLKPILARGDLRFIGATTPESYRRTIQKDPALDRRFQQVIIKEPTLDLSLEILKGVKERYELHHEVSITEEALKTANRLADRYISDRCLPDKAIDLIDEASAQIKLETSSKPKIIKELETDISRIEILLLEAKSRDNESEIDELKETKDLKINQLNNMNLAWQKELERFQELNFLVQEEENISNSIIEAEKEGDIEEAARIEYEELQDLRERKNHLKQSIEATKLSGNSLLTEHVEAEDIADVVSRWTGIPVNKVLAGERQKLLNLEKDLEKKVIGQIEAVEAVAAAIRRARAGMQDTRRPIGSFLFLGPTGVGKTELAKTLAASLFDEEEALIRLDMSEFMERNAVARLLGAPPGYVGYEEGGQLTEAVRRRPYAVLLLDEIEKAHPEVFNILLQVLDEGRLTDSQARTVDFRNTVIVMTSNLASRSILNNSKSINICEEEIEKNAKNQKLIQEIDQALSKQFRPEFLNRIDEIIKFKPLKPNDLKEIVRLQLLELGSLLSEKNITLSVDNKTIEILALEGYEPEYGARPLRRVLRRRLENPLATHLLEEKHQNARSVKVLPPNEESDSLIFKLEN